jgi:transcriptional antiterminator RfaH
MDHVHDAAMSWYVVHTHPRGEEMAVRNLLRQGFVAFLPQYRKRRRHARRVDWVRAPLFPRYLFLNMDIRRARWWAVSSTHGVNHLVCQGDRPVPVPPGVVDVIQARMDDEGLVPVSPCLQFEQGDSVQVIDGALAGHAGFFECPSGEERVVLLLELLGRQVKVKVPLAAVSPVL